MAVQHLTTAERRRREILVSAVDCFRRAGFHQTSMQDICAAAQMSPGTLYRYFASKDDLIVALVEEELARAFVYFDRIERADDLLTAMIDEADTMYWQVPDDGLGPLTADIAAEALRNPRIAEVCQRIEQACLARMGEVLKRGQQRGQVDPELDLMAAARLLFAIHDGAVIRQTFANTSDGAVAKATARRLLVRFLRPATLPTL
ncbi:MAG: TetR/AcrR family transcriptional regulator [Alphaproteobacteria bacterium]|nr:MAG: TetR/AcrR family transcriptional regulator [Alphaproteobacteria bacterium]